MMTLVELIMKVSAEIRDAVKDYQLLAENQGEKRVTVYEQHINDEAHEDDSYIPYVIVQLLSITDNEAGSGEEASIGNIGLTIVTYGKDQRGWLDLINLQETIRQRLLVKRVIGNQFRQVLPFEWVVAQNQPYPFWEAYAAVAYTIAQPVSTLPLMKWR